MATRTGDQLETHRQNMLAASSTDDITLLSKKKKRVSKTLSDSQHPSSSAQYPSSLASREGGSSKRGKLNPQKQDNMTHQSFHEKRAVSNGRNPLEKSHKKIIPATDIDSGQSVFVTNRDHKSMSCSPSHQPHPPKLKAIQTHVHSKSFDSAPSEPIKGSSVKHRNNINAELSNRSHGVNTLRGNFERLSHDISAPPPKSNGHTHHSRSTGRRNSTENSDSGRESMVLDY